MLSVAAWSFAQATPASPLRGAVQVSAGGAHTCARTEGGGLLCWGMNSAGQLGDGTRTGRTMPVAVVGLGSGARAVSAGAEHTCALTAAGGVKCWGLNYHGQLGDGHGAWGVSEPRPVDVSGLQQGVVAVVAGDGHSCAVTSAGAATCWGHNDHGQLGDGTVQQRVAPVVVSGLGSGVAAIAIGAAHSCALLANGGVKCWGANSYGQLGDGSADERRTPVAVPGLGGVVALGLGDGHSCARTAAGATLCWGDNGNGQLGDGTTQPHSTPAAVSGLGMGTAALGVGSSFDHSCALTAGARVLCWGEFYFPIGGTFPVASMFPVDRGFDGVQAFSAGGAGFVLTSHVCALDAQGGVKCLGGNRYGQLGNGQTNGYSDYVDAPVEVVLADAIFANGFDGSPERYRLSSRSLVAGDAGASTRYRSGDPSEDSAWPPPSTSSITRWCSTN
ncbi:RCC1 domain-containing protein [Dokdonella sp.]|uniref:RCC1 domain-containing protein n=1 Tax=Dokdonella sp. TaxID=2291710 RepID=UPI0026203B42|nr:RCC1 domain-containing protein [Dokdonella sp.]